MKPFSKILILAIGLILCAYPNPGMAQTAADTSQYFITTSAVYILHGPDKSMLQTFAGVGKRYGNSAVGHFSVMARAMVPDGEEEKASFNPTLLWVDPIISKLDFIAEIGGASESADGNWGIIAGIALNWRLAANSAIHAGMKLMQGTPGKWDNFGIGGGAALYVDELVKKIF